MKTDADLMNEFFETNHYVSTGGVEKFAKYSPDQPRDDHGRFGEGSGSVDTRKASSDALKDYAGRRFSYINGNLRSGKLDAVAVQVRSIDAAFKDPEQPERVVSTSEQNVQRGLFIEKDARTPEQKDRDMKDWLANVPPDVREAALKNPPVPSADEALANALESGTLKAGDVIRDKAFVSTTTDREVSFGFSAPRERDDEGNRVMLSGTHVIMNMHVPAGTVYLAPKGGAYGNENEQIYPRGSGIKITSIEKMPFANMVGEKYPGTDHSYTIHGEYVPPDVSKASAFWIPDHAVDITPSKLKKYSPDQPRDDHGRFGSDGGTSTNEEPRFKRPEDFDQKFYDKQRDEIALRGEMVARKLGFPTDKIAYNANPPPTFSLNGKTIEYAGAANLKTGEITIYTRNTPNAQAMDSVMSHEIGHQMYQPVVDEFHNELERAKDHERIPRSDDVGNIRMMDLMTPDGRMRTNGVDPKLASQLKESFPVWSTVGEVDNASTSQELADKDGISDYSREWWKAANAGTATRHQAMHETMAEINRVVYESKRGSGKMWDSEEAKQVAPVWRRYYRAYAKAFADMQKRRKS